MRSNLLGRQALFTAPSSLSNAQIKLDATLENFSHEAGNFENIAAMTLGSGVFKLARAGALSLTARFASRSLNALSYVAALSAEVTAFRGSHCLFEKAQGRIPSESVFEGEGFFRTFTDFLALKGAGQMAQGQNLFLTHTLQSSAMVASRYANASLGLLPRPQGSFVEQLVEAESTNIALGAGQGLFGILSGYRVHMMERSLDIRTESILEASAARRNRTFLENPLRKNILAMNAGEPADPSLNGNGGDIGDFFKALGEVAEQSTPPSPQEAIRQVQDIVLEWFHGSMAEAHQKIADGQLPRLPIFNVLRDRRFMSLLPDDVRIRLQAALDQIDVSHLSNSPPPIDPTDPTQLYFMSGTADANIHMAGQLLKEFAKVVRQDPSTWIMGPGNLALRLTGLAYYYRRLFESTQREKDQDFLTGLKNRGAFDRLTPKIEATLTHHHRARETLVGEYWIIMLDGDRFKSVNDTYGHPNGDRVLRHFAKVFQDSIRELNGDYVFRVGGEEFLILLRNPGIQGIARVTKEIQRKLRESPVQMQLTAEQQESGLPAMIYPTVSMGAAPLRMLETEEGLTHVGSLEAVVKKADAALYEAKHAGRNQMMVAGKKEGQFIDEHILEEMIAQLP